MVTLGTLAGAFVADREARRRGHNPDHVWNALIVVMITGLIGARLYHVFSSPAGGPTNLQYYLDNPIEIISFWDGGLRGLGIIGAIIGGVLGLWAYTKWAGLVFSEWLDIAAVGLPLGQAIGRWGNYFNQELYGNPTKLPWGVEIEPGYRLTQFQTLPADTNFHPTFLYESLWCLLMFFVLSYVSHYWGDKLRNGDIALLYLVLYPLGRSIVELQRPDAWLIGGIPAAQIFAVLSMFLASLALLARHGMFRTRPGQMAEA
jgi:phosphatidylglycerol:prolipoprotein diacylglycerol transferase